MTVAEHAMSRNRTVNVAAALLRHEHSWPRHEAVVSSDRSICYAERTSLTTPLSAARSSGLMRTARLTLGDDVYEQKLWINTG
jgi:hypothetical protein